MNKERIAIISIIVIVVGVTLIAAHFGKRQRSRYLDMEFSGTVLDIDYDIKNYPTVNVDGVSFYIGSYYFFDNQIEKGDSLIKKRNQYVFELVKKKSGKRLCFSE